MEREEAYLNCPDCDGRAVIAKSYWRGRPTWCEDDEGECEDCKNLIGCTITGDEDGDYIEGYVICKKCMSARDNCDCVEEDSDDEN